MGYTTLCMTSNAWEPWCTYGHHTLWSVNTAKKNFLVLWQCASESPSNLHGLYYVIINLFYGSHDAPLVTRYCNQWEYCEFVLLVYWECANVCQNHWVSIMACTTLCTIAIAFAKYFMVAMLHFWWPDIVVSENTVNLFLFLGNVLMYVRITE